MERIDFIQNAKNVEKYIYNKILRKFENLEKNIT